MSQGFQYYIKVTNQFLIYSKFILNIINIIERKVYKFNTLHLKCFSGFRQQLENQYPRFLLTPVLILMFRTTEEADGVFFLFYLDKLV